MMMLFLSGCGEKEEFLSSSSMEEDIPELAEQSSNEEVMLCVYICGAVKRPGVYELPYGSRVYEAVDLAGGFTEDACEDYWNLALELSDGMQIRVPFLEESMESTGYIEADDRVDLNRATVQELCTLPGVGESRAYAIIAYREEHGGFQAIEELMQVSGIKSGIYEKIKDRIKV